MPTAREFLLSTIEDQRPLVLVLGQQAWVDSETADTLLSTMFTKLGRTSTNPRWIEMFDGSLPAEHYEWLAERFESRPHPKSIEAISGLPWSAIFTSSLDPTLTALLRRQGRDPEPILTSDEYPRSARSRARPPLYYLFSRAGEHDPDAQPPRNHLGLNTRRVQHAMPLLNRVLDTATSLGTVVVDGFVSEGDWLGFEDLLGALASAFQCQILWFGSRPSLILALPTFSLNWNRQVVYLPTQRN